MALEKCISCEGACIAGLVDAPGRPACGGPGEPCCQGKKRDAALSCALVSCGKDRLDSLCQ